MNSEGILGTFISILLEFLFTVRDFYLYNLLYKKGEFGLKAVSAVGAQWDVTAAGDICISISRKDKRWDRSHKKWT